MTPHDIRYALESAAKSLRATREWCMDEGHPRCKGGAAVYCAPCGANGITLGTVERVLMSLPAKQSGYSCSVCGAGGFTTIVGAASCCALPVTSTVDTGLAAEKARTRTAEDCLEAVSRYMLRAYDEWSRSMRSGLAPEPAEPEESNTQPLQHGTPRPCSACSEPLDERDRITGGLRCWRCGALTV